MKAIYRAVVGVALVVMVSGMPSFAADEELVVTLRGVLTNGYQAYADEDLEGTLQYIHTKSPDYDATRKRMAAQFEKFDLDVELLDFRYIGHDDEFAVARVHYKTTGGPDFEDNVTDAMVLFKQEAGRWKFWTDLELGVVFVEE